MIKHFLPMLLLCLFSTKYCLAQQAIIVPNAASGLNAGIQIITEVIIHDIFTPPAASRIYAYSCIAAYEALLPKHPQYTSFSNKLNNLNILLPQEHGLEICYPLASIAALFKTANHFIFSESLLKSLENELYTQLYKDSIPKQVFLNSIEYGYSIAQQVINWSKSDHYQQTRILPRYTLLKIPGSWEPTPPDYADAVEPYWSKIRPFALDSASQFKPQPPAKFSTDASSLFYQSAFEVYNLGLQLTPEQIEIVNFWDDNPFSTSNSGHLSYAIKKVSPAGHWIGITQIAIEETDLSLIKAAQAYALVSIALADGFISCWDSKYSTHLLRPETYISKYIDQNWKPYLQTPPFPEFTSGHSVVSSAAASVLTALFSDKFAFTDSVEVLFELPPRSFNSFNEAAQEASLSRLLGGIHFKFGINEGQLQGKKVGQLILEKLY